MMMTKKGLTLVEMVLALALVAVILVSLSTILGVSLKAWKAGDEKPELVQNARVAMERMMSDLRYAVSISQFSGGILEFDTKYIEDEDDFVETIKYYKSGASLYRAVNDEAAPPIVAEFVDAFDITLCDADGDTVVLAGDAVFAQVSLTLLKGNDTFTLASSAFLQRCSPTG